MGEGDNANTHELRKKVNRYSASARRCYCTAPHAARLATALGWLDRDGLGVAAICQTSADGMHPTFIREAALMGVFWSRSRSVRAHRPGDSSLRTACRLLPGFCGLGLVPLAILNLGLRHPQLHALQLSLVIRSSPREERHITLKRADDVNTYTSNVQNPRHRSQGRGPCVSSERPDRCIIVVSVGRGCVW